MLASGQGDADRRVQDALMGITKMIGEFDDVRDEGGHLRPMKGDPMEINMKNDVAIKLLHICNLRKMPYAIQQASKAKLDKMMRRGSLREFICLRDAAGLCRLLRLLHCAVRCV